MNESLILPRPLVQKLFAHAQSEPGAEVCGLIGAIDGSACSHYPVQNNAPEPDRLFDMDAQSQIAAPPEPSDRDAAGLGYPDAWYLIIYLNIKGVLEMRAWREEGGKLTEHKVQILPD